MPEVKQEVVKKITEGIVNIQDYADTLTVVENKQQAIEAMLYVVDANDLISEVGKGYDDVISDAHALHKKLIATKKNYCDPLKKAKEYIIGLIGAWEKREQIRLDKEAEDERVRLQKEQDKLIAKAGKKIDKLTDGIADNEETKAILVAELEDKTVTPLVAEQIRERIRVIDIQLANAAKQVSETSTKVALPVAPPAAPKAAKAHTKGMRSTVKIEITVINPLQAVEAIVKNPNLIGVIKFDDVKLIALKKAGIEVAGIQYSESLSHSFGGRV